MRALPLLFLTAAVTLSPAPAGAQRFAPDAEPEIRSPGLVSAGITLTGGGIVTTSLGALIFATMPSDGVHYTGLFVGVPMMTFGASLLVTGIPLWVVGALDAPTAKAASKTHPDQRAALRSTLIVGFDRAAIRWQF